MTSVPPRFWAAASPAARTRPTASRTVRPSVSDRNLMAADGSGSREGAQGTGRTPPAPRCYRTVAATGGASDGTLVPPRQRPVPRVVSRHGYPVAARAGRARWTQLAHVDADRVHPEPDVHRLDPGLQHHQRGADRAALAGASAGPAHRRGADALRGRLPHAHAARIPPAAGGRPVGGAAQPRAARSSRRRRVVAASSTASVDVSSTTP